MASLKVWVAAVLGDRRRAQSGPTLIEVLVALSIASLAVALVVGTISSGLLDAALAKRNTAAQAVLEYEMEQVSATTFSTSAAPYSDCFATEQPTNPITTSYQGSCQNGYTVRADVSCLPTCSSSPQTWTIAITAWPSGASAGKSIQLLKVAHQ